jgi:hypothetical protein
MTEFWRTRDGRGEGRARTNHARLARDGFGTLNLESGQSDQSSLPQADDRSPDLRHSAHATSPRCRRASIVSSSGSGGNWTVSRMDIAWQLTGLCWDWVYTQREERFGVRIARVVPTSDPTHRPYNTQEQHATADGRATVDIICPVTPRTGVRFGKPKDGERQAYHCCPGAQRTPEATPHDEAHDRHPRRSVCS